MGLSEASGVGRVDGGFRSGFSEQGWGLTLALHAAAGAAWIGGLGRRSTATVRPSRLYLTLRRRYSPGGRGNRCLTQRSLGEFGTPRIGPGDGLRLHDFRRTCVGKLAEAGCSTAEIGAITGHSDQSVHRMMRTYLPKTFAMARNAITKLEKNR